MGWDEECLTSKTDMEAITWSSLTSYVRWEECSKSEIDTKAITQSSPTSWMRWDNDSLTRSFWGQWLNHHSRARSNGTRNVQWAGWTWKYSLDHHSLPRCDGTRSIGRVRTSWEQWLDYCSLARSNGDRESSTNEIVMKEITRLSPTF